MASNQNAKPSGRSRGGKTGAKRGRPKGKKIATIDGPPPTDEETPVIISGGSIKVGFNPDFEEDTNPSVKVKKVKHPTEAARFTRVIVSLGKLKDDGSNILNQFPPNGVDLNKSCFIYVFSVSK
ncbi:MAG TPA: hypothetical protein VF553_21205 [Pyrinomonadaceae bacterium]|jgi:hypothetical protein